MDPVVQLKEHRLATTDLDEAREILTRRYCSHSLFKRTTAPPWTSAIRTARCSTSRFNILQYGAEVDIRPREFETFYLVHIPLAGRAIDACGRASIII